MEREKRIPLGKHANILTAEKQDDWSKNCFQMLFLDGQIRLKKKKGNLFKILILRRKRTSIYLTKFL